MTVFRPSASVTEGRDIYSGDVPEINDESFRTRLMDHIERQYKRSYPLRPNDGDTKDVRDMIKLLSEEEADKEPPCVVCGGEIPLVILG